MRLFSPVCTAALTAALAGSHTACTSSVRDDPAVEIPSDRVTVPRQRSFRMVSWTPLWRIGGESATDTSVIRPAMVRASGDAVVLYDFGAKRVLVLTRDGLVRGRVGRSGAGPGEFGRLVDFQIDSARQVVLLLDIGNSRITTLRLSDLTMTERAIKVSGYATGLVPLDSHRVLVVTTQRRAALQTLDSNGTLVGASDFPWEGADQLPEIARQAYVTANGSRWVYAYMLAGAWFPFRGSSYLGFVGSTVDGHVLFPHVSRQVSRRGTSEFFDSYTPCKTCDIGLDGSIVYLLAGGTDSTAKHVLDAYDFGSGKYLYSYRIPYAATFFSVSNRRLFISVEDPLPQILSYDLPP